MLATKTANVDDEASDRSSAAGLLAGQHMAVRLSNIGLALSRGATAYYRAAFGLSMVEWRLLMALDTIESLNVGELSDAADVDKAAASRSLVLLQQRQLVSVEQTRTRGRAAIVRLTAEGRKLAKELLRVSRQREARLFKDFNKTEMRDLDLLLRRLTDALAGADWSNA